MELPWRRGFRHQFASCLTGKTSEMRSTILRLAESVSKAPLNLQEASASLYPPIPYAMSCLIILGHSCMGSFFFLLAWLHNSLYRQLLRAHRNLPQDMRPLGDSYVKSGNVFFNLIILFEILIYRIHYEEFRRHREITNPAHIIGFLSQWKMYLDQIPSGGEHSGNFSGKRLDPTVFEKVLFSFDST